MLLLVGWTSWQGPQASILHILGFLTRLVGALALLYEGYFGKVVPW